MKIEIKNIKRADGKGTYDETFVQNEKGQWEIEGEEFLGKILEEDVIEFVKKHDRKNLNKYFPMSGFHN